MLPSISPASARPGRTRSARRSVLGAALSVALGASALPLAGAASASDDTLSNAPVRTLQSYAAAPGSVQDSPQNLSSPGAGVSRVHMHQDMRNGYKVRAALPTRDEAVLSYKVLVPRDVHDRGLAQVDLKMPGLGGLPGGQSPWYTSSGGNLQPDAWSVRMHTRPSASYNIGHPWWHVYVYAQHAGGKAFDTWGIQIPLSTELNGAGTRLPIPTDRWFDITMRVKMNTPGVNDGQLDVWVDGRQGARLTDVRWRGAGVTTPVNQLMAETFYNLPGAPQNGHIDLKDFRVAGQLDAPAPAPTVSPAPAPALAPAPAATVSPAPALAPAPVPTQTAAPAQAPADAVSSSPAPSAPVSNGPTPSPAPAPVPAVHVSDTAFTTVRNGWGPVERDESNGGGAASDGPALTIRGQRFAKGLGTHASSEVIVPVGGAATFTTLVGVDDYTKRRGSVVFQVWDGTSKLADSGLVRGGQRAKRLTVDVTGRTSIRLVVTDAGDGSRHDHADWVDAKLLNGSTISTALQLNRTLKSRPLFKRLSRG